MSRRAPEVAAVFELERMLHRAAAERIEDVECGFVAANPQLPAVWESSLVQVEPDREAPEAETLLELSELPSRWFSGLRHRYAFIGGIAGREPAFSLARHGWTVNELWLMVTHREPRRLPSNAEPISGESMRRIKGRLGVEQGLPPDTVSQFDRYDRLRERLAARETWAALDPSGNPGAVADAFLRGDIAVIEDVATLKRLRHQGLGTAAVLGATAKAIQLGARAVALFAEPEVARGFYERLGFERIEVAFDCQLPPPGERPFVRG